MKSKRKYTQRIIFTLSLFITGLLFIAMFISKQSGNEMQNKFFWTQKVHSMDTYNCVVLGDSRVYRGIDPVSFSAGWGNQAPRMLNYGFSSGSLNNEMFSAAINRLDKNKQGILLVGITPFSLTEKAAMNEHYRQESTRKKSEIYERLYVYPFLQYFTPLAPQKLIFKDTAYYFEKHCPDGWIMSYKYPYNTTTAVQKYQQEFEENRVSDERIQELFRNIKNCVTSGIEVYAFRIPSSPEMEKTETEYGGFNEQKIIEGVTLSGGKWITVNTPQSYFSYDGSHLHYLSAQKFSLFLGKEISRLHNRKSR